MSYAQVGRVVTAEEQPDHQGRARGGEHRRRHHPSNLRVGHQSRPVRSRMTRIRRMSPAPPPGYGPHPELYGRAGEDPPNMGTRMTISTMDPSRASLRAPGCPDLLASWTSTWRS